MAAASAIPPRKYFHRFCNIMAKHPEICCLLVAVAFTLCTKYTQSQSRILMAPQGHPHRFFSSISPVIDFPYGNIGAVAHLLVEQEIIFVMYYAPWCAKSMRVQQEFERAATYMHDEVTFVGINCWYEGGQCRQQNQFLAFPVLIAYHTTLDGFRYNGVLKADYMVDFMQRLIYPVTRVTSKEHLGMFLAERDHIVLGFFDFHASPQPPGYEQFYYAAMRTLEKDPRNVVKFGVITSPALAATFQMTESRTLALTMPYNDTLRYDISANFTSSAISTWVQSTKELVRQSIVWMLPSGVKSLALFKKLSRGPVVILFTKHSPLTEVNQYHSMMREISLVYHNCDHLTRIQNIADSSIYVRWNSAKTHIETRDRCQKHHACQKEQQDEEDERRQRLQHSVVAQSCCTSFVPQGIPRFCDVCIHYLPTHPLSSKHCPLTGFPHLPWHTLQTLGLCSELQATYNPSEYISACCQYGNFSHTRRKITRNLGEAASTRPSQYTDPYIENIVKHSTDKECRNLRLKKAFGWMPNLQFSGLSLTPVDESLTGLGCRTNQTVTFLSMDTKGSSMFAEKLGVDLHGNKTVAVLVQEEREAQYLLDSEVNKKNVVTWLQMFTEGALTRQLRSTQVAPLKCDLSVSDVCIVELSTATYDQVVMEEEKDVLVLYYAPWCGFCAGFAHVYLSLARYFKTAKNLVFTRINADKNDLRWQLTVDRFPTLHFFPAHRKAESVSFPDHLAKTLPNLLQFVLTYTTPDLRLQTGLSICSRICIQNNLQSCSKRIQELNTEIRTISNRLSHWKLKRELLQQKQTTDGRDEGHTLSTKIAHIDGQTRLLQSQLRRYQLQLGSARHLHKVLLTSQGFYIDKHKLTGVIKQHKKMEIPREERDSQHQVESEENSRNVDSDRMFDLVDETTNVHDGL